MNVIIRSTKTKQVIDVTDLVSERLAGEKIKNGLCHLFLKHTSAALTTADLDPGTDLDMLDAFEKMVPKLNYRHPHNPEHVPDHILSSVIGSSLMVPFKDSRLDLGTWQKVILVELDGPRERDISITLINGNNK